MASKPDFVAYIAEQLSEAGHITYRKIFGDYGMYCDGKIFALVCDGQFFIKITQAGRELCPELQEAAPYEGARNYFIIDDVDDRRALVKLVTVTCAALPESKLKKRRR